MHAYAYMYVCTTVLTLSLKGLVYKLNTASWLCTSEWSEWSTAGIAVLDLCGHRQGASTSLVQQLAHERRSQVSVAGLIHLYCRYLFSLMFNFIMDFSQLRFGATPTEQTYVRASLYG